MPSARLRQLFVEYEEAHRHPLNRLTHKFAIPLIVFHLVAMLDWVRWGPFSLGQLAYVLTVAWYLRMDAKLGLWMAALMALCFPLASVTPRSWVIALAVVGWSIQLAGHVLWEKKSPSFFRNLVQALVGPVYFIALVTRAWPERTAARY